jgi:hypothetical protein
LVRSDEDLNDVKIKAGKISINFLTVEYQNGLFHDTSPEDVLDLHEKITSFLVSNNGEE